MSFHVGCTHARYTRDFLVTRLLSLGLSLDRVSDLSVKSDPRSLFQISGGETKGGLMMETSLDIGGWKRWKVDILEIHRLLLKTCWNFYLNSLNSGEIFRGGRNAWRKNGDEFWNENGRVKKIKFHIHIEKR